MYARTMLVGPVTLVSFGGLSIHVGSTLASGTKKHHLQRVSVTHVTVPLTWTLKQVLNSIQLLVTWTFIVRFLASCSVHVSGDSSILNFRRTAPILKDIWGTHACVHASACAVNFVLMGKLASPMLTWTL